MNMMLVTLPRWPPYPYLVKAFKNLLFKNRSTDFHETWYVASGTPAHYSLFKWWPWVDDLFNGKVKFGNLSEACDMKVGRCRQLIELMKVRKVKVISWPWPQCIYIWNLKLVFLRNYLASFNQGNENPWTWCWSHDQDGCYAHLW